MTSRADRVMTFRTEAGKRLAEWSAGDEPVPPDDWLGAILEIETEAAQEVRDDIRARLGNPYEWNPGYCPWCDKTMLTEGHAADCLFAAISSSSATETQDGLPDANRVGGYSAYGEPYAEDAYDSATETQDGERRIDPSWCDCGDATPIRGIEAGRHLPSCRYGIIEDYLDTIAPTPDDRDREEFAQAAEPIVRWYMEHVADPEVVAKWAGLRASGGD